MKSQRGRAGRRGGARVSTVDCARSPYGESTFKRNRPSFAVLMVLGGGGGLKKAISWGDRSEHEYSRLPSQTITYIHWPYMKCGSSVLIYEFNKRLMIGPEPKLRVAKQFLRLLR